MPGRQRRKEAIMDKSIDEMGQDLARAKYSKRTQHDYVQAATELRARFGKPVTEITRDELRSYVDALVARGQSASWLSNRLSALLFLYRRTCRSSNIRGNTRRCRRF